MRFLAVSLLVIPTLASAQTQRPVTVFARDYAFGPLDTLKAGATLFSLENKGTVRHELVLLLLKPGVTLTDLLNAKTPEERRALYDGSPFGLLLTEPGTASRGRLLAELQSGGNYVLICNLRDMPEKPPHAQLGMVAQLHVK